MFSGSHFEEKSRLMFRVNFWKPTTLWWQTDPDLAESLHKENLSTSSPLSLSPLSTSPLRLTFMWCFSTFPLFFYLSCHFAETHIFIYVFCTFEPKSYHTVYNANTFLSLDGYPPNDCWKMKHPSSSFAKKEGFFLVINMFPDELVSAISVVAYKKRN